MQKAKSIQRLSNNSCTNNKEPTLLSNQRVSYLAS